jgi:type I site-specific restriction-modification system R (restriction) subunit
MFSLGQKERMRGFLTTLDTLNGLYLDNNLIATGLLQPTAITELPNNENKKLLKIVDVLGRNTPYKKNTPLFYLYDNGTVEKKIIME